MTVTIEMFLVTILTILCIFNTILLILMITHIQTASPERRSSVQPAAPSKEELVSEEYSKDLENRRRKELEEIEAFSKMMSFNADKAYGIED